MYTDAYVGEIYYSIYTRHAKKTEKRNEDDELMRQRTRKYSFNFKEIP